MGIDALTHSDDGMPVPAPVSEHDWQAWVSIWDTRNWMLGDPLIDWLDLYGNKLGTVSKEEAGDYNADLDFGKFAAEKAGGFRAGIRRLLAQDHEAVTIARGRQDAKRLDRARETFAAMERGAGGNPSCRVARC